MLLSSLNIHSLSPPYQNPLVAGVNSDVTPLLVLLICHSGAGAGVTKVSGVTPLSPFCQSGSADGVTLVSGVTPALVLVSLQCLVSLLCHSSAGPGVTLVHWGIRCHFIVGVSVLPVNHHQVLKIIEICYKLSMV